MIAIAGAGAVGGTTAAYLRRAGLDVLLVDPWHQNVQAVRREGLHLKSRDEEFRVGASALERGDLARNPANLDAFLAPA